MRWISARRRRASFLAERLLSMAEDEKPLSMDFVLALAWRLDEKPVLATFGLHQAPCLLNEAIR